MPPEVTITACARSENEPLSRRELAVQGRRQPDDVELLTMPADWVVVRCADRRSSVEIAMARTTLTGFLSWIEAAPPGAASRSLAH